MIDVLKKRLKTLKKRLASSITQVMGYGRFEGRKIIFAEDEECLDGGGNHH